MEFTFVDFPGQAVTTFDRFRGDVRGLDIVTPSHL
jgi:hypothetical protein